MGIVNITPDSFYDGGRFDTPEAVRDRAAQLVDEGADIVDIGGESSRPGAQPVSPDVELRRVIPAIEAIRQVSDCCISVDTYRSATAEAAIEAGADMINDISAMQADPEMAGTLLKYAVPVVLMHMKGRPSNMQVNPAYDDCVAEIGDFFDERLRFCDSIGMDRSRIILDPGIGFGKRLRDNLDILSHLHQFGRFDRPLLIGASRKSFMGMLSDEMGSADFRLGGSIAAAVMAVRSGADILRVHDVRETVGALKVARAIGEAE
jgi:dihydropteroate synthase